MTKTLIVCEKPHTRREIEKFCSANLPVEDIRHYDTIAHVLAWNDKNIGPIKKIVNGYTIGEGSNTSNFFPFELKNNAINTNRYVISPYNREKRTYITSYDKILFACDSDMESVCSAYEYCERNDIPLNKAFFIGVVSLSEGHMKNILNPNLWIPMENPKAIQSLFN